MSIASDTLPAAPMPWSFGSSELNVVVSLRSVVVLVTSVVVVVISVVVLVGYSVVLVVESSSVVVVNTGNNLEPLLTEMFSSPLRRFS